MTEIRFSNVPSKDTLLEALSTFKSSGETFATIVVVLPTQREVRLTITNHDSYETVRKNFCDEVLTTVLNVGLCL